jgi:SAM-dependent methyltransferase
MQPLKEYNSAEHALSYLARADSIPHRASGESALLEFVPREARRILDLGAGDGRLLALLGIDRPESEGIAADLSPTMLDAARTRFAGDPLVKVVECDLDARLPDLGRFDAVVSSFAIHHCTHARKRELYGEIFDVLAPAGVFYNLEHVASASPRLHELFLEALGITAEQEDKSNKLLDIESQLAWLREIGFEDVDCHWKWRELALFGGVKPLSP